MLAAIATTGTAGDGPFLPRLLYHAWRRTGGRIRCVVADTGYDSEANHRLARRGLGVRSIIPARACRPGGLPPIEPLRRNMHYRFRRAADKQAYGQRWQCETAHSMIKRNLGSAMRARTAVHRRHELLLRVITHNIMLLAEG